MSLEAMSNARLVLNPDLMEKTRRASLAKIVHEKGREWAIVAMIDGSIGYHSVTSAANTIDQLLKGGRLWACERTFACYHGDPLAELESDFAYFERKESYATNVVKELVEYVRQAEPQLAKLGPTQRWEVETTNSMLYPTRRCGLTRSKPSNLGERVK
jgi:hypothetical protein